MLVGTQTTLFDSPLDPWSTLSLLIIVLAISICKEGAEDLKRHRADKQTNDRLTQRIVSRGQAVVESISWKEICVGDILVLHNNDEIPADVIILSSSDTSGVVYIETANIDGETNLKLKNSAKSGPNGPVWKSPSDLRK